MILIDTNLLVYAAVDSSPEHPRAEEWLNAQFAAAARMGLPWHSLLGYVRLASSPSSFKTGPSVSDAWNVVRKWLSAPNIWIPQPTVRHADIIDDLLASANVRSRDVMDIHLAALAIEHDLTLCSNDSGFARYPKLRWMNPLAT